MVLDITRVKLKFSQRTITNTCLIVTTNRKNEKNQLSSKIRAGRSFRESVCTKKENIFSQHSFHRCFVICQGKIIRSRTISSNRLTLLISKCIFIWHFWKNHLVLFQDYQIQIFFPLISFLPPLWKSPPSTKQDLFGFSNKCVLIKYLYLYL